MTPDSEIDKEQFIKVTFYEDEFELPPLNDEELIIYA